MAAGFLFAFAPSLSCASNTSNCSGSSANAENCDECISSSFYTTANAGNEIISAMFTAINGVLANVEQSFFNGIIGATSFQQAIGVAMLLYIAMYGFMITFGLSSHKTGEVMNRLMKVGIVYMMTAPGAWAAFNTWVGNPVIGGMNQIINEFIVVAEGGSSLTTINLNSGGSTGLGSLFGSSATGGGLDPNAFQTMFGSSITTVLSPQLGAAILGLLTTGFFGWLVAVFVLWGIIEFVIMMLGALVTYAKAIIGLSFLFALAPMFFIFLLFEKSRPIFQAWLNQVLTFALQPIMLFAFLSFYISLINQAAPNILSSGSGSGSPPTDFCWSKWVSIPGTLWDFYSFRPTSSGGVVTQDWMDTSSGTVLDSPISVPNVIYFLMLCNLGKTFTGFIAQLAGDIGGGTGPGIVRIDDITNGVKKAFSGMSGSGWKSEGRGRFRKS